MITLSRYCSRGVGWAASGILALLLLALLDSTLASLASSAKTVYTRSSYGQLVSSTTLRWESADSSKGFSTRDSHVVRVNRKDRDSAAVCRGWYQNILVPGMTLKTGGDGEGQLHCAVTFNKRLHLLDSYQVMTDRAGTSRLEWRHWDQFTKMPVGVVSFTEESTYVARKASRHQVGAINLMPGFKNEMVAFDPDTMTTIDEVKGQMLVEVEPIRYEMESIRFIDWREKVQKEEVCLGARVLSNSAGESDNEELAGSGEWTDLSTIVTYNATYQFYWGQMAGLIKALPTSAETFSKKQRLEFKWGMPHKYERHRIMKISDRLLPGTSSNVSVWAFNTRRELPYTAKLVSIFESGKTKTKRVEGFYVETLLTDVELKRGSPYFTETGELSPTTTTTTTTARPTTTTTTTTTTTSTTLRPKRTTTQLPTTVNPLRKFYPAEDDDDSDDIEDLEEMMRFDEGNVMMSDQAGGSKRGGQGGDRQKASPLAASTASTIQLSVATVSFLLITTSVVGNVRWM